MNRAIAVLLISCSSAFTSFNVQAQTYPNRPIRVIAQRLTEAWGQQVVVDNRPRAGAIVGTELGAHALPDGYTLTMGVSSAFGINPTLYSKLPYDAVRDFAPITNIALTPQSSIRNREMGESGEGFGGKGGLTAKAEIKDAKENARTPSNACLDASGTLCAVVCVSWAPPTKWASSSLRGSDPAPDNVLAR